MAAQTARKPPSEPVRQFSVFTPNRLGRLHDLIVLFSTHEVHVLGLTVLDTTDSSILRLVVDDPDRARELLTEHKFAFTESKLIAVEIDSETKVRGVLAALLEAEININYLYSFIIQPNGVSVLALSLEDRDVAMDVLARHQFRLLDQADLSR